MQKRECNTSSSSKADSKNRKQYQAFPYPPRIPSDENARLIAPMMDCFDVLNHRAFGGCRDFSKGLRVLVAGGGTGDSVVFLAEQLRHTQSVIDYVDLSEASMNVAKERAKRRGLQNINWHCGSLLDFSAVADDLRYDYINCSGVLHHLDDPAVGLQSLKALLDEKGAIGVMLYGKHAREGFYQLQSLLKMLNGQNDSFDDRLDVAKSLLSNLPEFNLFSRTASNFSDHTLGDAGIVDLLLHENDRAFSVLQIYELAETVGLTLNSFVEPHLYSPDYYFDSPNITLVEAFKSLAGKERRQAVELYCGSIKTHAFYLTNQKLKPPEINTKCNIPSLPLTSNPQLYKQLANLVSKKKGGDTFCFNHGAREVKFEASSVLAAAISLMDGDRTLSEIYQSAAKQVGCLEARVTEKFLAFYKVMARHGLIFLRDKTVPGYASVEQMQSATFSS